MLNLKYKCSKCGNVYMITMILAKYVCPKPCFGTLIPSDTGVKPNRITEPAHAGKEPIYG